MTDYVITQTVPSVFLDRRGIAVNGYLVYFELTEFSEVHQVNVTSLDPTQVDRAIREVLKQRKALAKLGEPPK
jgi:hypothetical protein